MLAAITLTVGFLYEGRGSYRYLTPLIWWPVIFGAAAVTAVLFTRYRGVLALFSWSSVAVPVALILHTGVAPNGSLWNINDSTCVSDLGLRDGLAGFWQARRIEVMSDWKYQIDPITPDGKALFWGNDLARYRESRFDLSRRPAYRFVVMTDLDPQSIIDQFGEPNEKRSCGLRSVWVYDQDIVVR
ncbi:MAG: hypothetical protein E7813_11210 [Bradyrhizobium sp.]|uniref:hypothetical protein n=1 Tax=Bradyrhizobium sp. TaxID=376 RepID=UPI0011F8DCB6|nr:hypothetical protein [Bradyrhizobium sp.]THD68198.1 MAG: hypothetical protein E7813_11210 [Bradyrhizobium sp.]